MKKTVEDKFLTKRDGPFLFPQNFMPWIYFKKTTNLCTLIYTVDKIKVYALVKGSALVLREAAGTRI